MSRDGLLWKDTGFALQPQWAREPSIKSIEQVCRRHLDLDKDQVCSVSSFASGAFNKLYLVQTPAEKMLMRVSLPVDPHNKTRGEVATLQIIQQQTQIPVPEVLAFNDAGDDEIGFEWILMSLMPGAPLRSKWRRMPMAQKVSLVEQLAEFQVQLSQIGVSRGGFRKIGTLIHSQEQADGPVQNQSNDGVGKPMPTPGPLVDSDFFAGRRYDYDVSRGPFASSHDWLASCLEIVRLDREAELGDAEDEEDEEDGKETLRVLQKLLDLLPKLFPSNRCLFEQAAEQTSLWHYDISRQNILVDDDGKITAIVDWECVSAMPLWVSTRMPKLLVGQERKEEPIRDVYANEDDEFFRDNTRHDKANDLDNEGKNELYWHHLLDYEQTVLRQVYSDRMRQFRPDWDSAVKDGRLKNDFWDAAEYLGKGLFVKRVELWIDKVKAGDTYTLQEALSLWCSIQEETSDERMEQATTGRGETPSEG